MSQPGSPGSRTPGSAPGNPPPEPGSVPATSIPSHMRAERTSISSPSPSTPSQAASTTPHEVEHENTSPSSARHTGHSVSVSLRPRSDSNASAKHAPLRGIRTSFGSAREAKAQPDDEEANLTSEGGEPDARRRRRSSIVDRLRDSVSIAAPRERVSSVGSGPAGYEMMGSRKSHDGGDERGQELNDEVVGMLDVIDPEVSTVNHLQNVTNGIFLPHFPALWSRRPEIKLGNDDNDNNRSNRHEPSDTDHPEPEGTRKRSSTVASLYPSTDRRPSYPRSSMRQSDPNSIPRLSTRNQSNSNSPADTPSAQYPPKSAELHNTNSRDSYASDHELDAHVRQVLHESKREKIKKGMKGLWVFLKTPMGFATGIYGILVVFWGAAIVFFLAGWIPTSDKWWQDRWVEISSQIVNGLFTITGVGLIPWRVQDTYRMSIIWTLRQRLHRLRKKQGLPPVADLNDIEDPKEQDDYVSVLSDKERASLKYQQEMFAKSQTWYRPHATSTHRAFPMSWALWNTILMDLNSAFQCILCGCMWGLSQYKRPAWTTGSLIPLSFLCGIGAGVCIWQGSARTKKRDTVTDKLRQALGVPMAMAPMAIAVPAGRQGGILPLIDKKKAAAGSAENITPLQPTQDSLSTTGYPAASNGAREKDTIAEEREEEVRDGSSEAGRRTA